MIESRRLLEMGNKVHWYLCFLLFGVILFYEGALIFEADSAFIAFVSNTVSTGLFIALVIGIWIFVYCFFLFVKYRTFSLRPFLANFVRIFMIVILDFIFSFSFNIAGKSILII